MIERLLRHLRELLLGIVVFSFLLGLALGIAHHGRMIVASITRAIPTILAGVAATLLTGTFFIGLGARVHQIITDHGGRAGRELGARERQVRLTVRRVAEGVPATTTPELPEDSDPAISMEEN